MLKISPGINFNRFSSFVPCFFFSLMLARWNLPLLLFVLCWLIGWLVAFYRRLKVDSFSHTRLASGFRAAVWTGERGRNWASARKLSEGKLIEHETTFNFGPFFFCLRRGIVNTCWGLYLDSILFNGFKECLIFTAIDTHTSGIAIWHFGLTFFFSWFNEHTHTEIFLNWLLDFALSDKLNQSLAVRYTFD